MSLGQFEAVARWRLAEACGGDTGRPCDPPQVGETIVLTAGHPDTNPDLEFYCD